MKRTFCINFLTPLSLTHTLFPLFLKLVYLPAMTLYIKLTYVSPHTQFLVSQKCQDSTLKQKKNKYDKSRMMITNETEKN